MKGRGEKANIYLNGATEGHDKKNNGIETI